MYYSIVANFVPSIEEHEVKRAINLSVVDKYISSGEASKLLEVLCYGNFTDEKQLKPLIEGLEGLIETIEREIERQSSRYRRLINTHEKERWSEYQNDLDRSKEELDTNIIITNIILKICKKAVTMLQEEYTEMYQAFRCSGDNIIPYATNKHHKRE